MKHKAFSGGLTVTMAVNNHFSMCLHVKARSDHHAGSVRRRPSVVDGSHGWERTSRLLWLQVVLMRYEKKSERDIDGQHFH